MCFSLNRLDHGVSNSERPAGLARPRQSESLLMTENSRAGIVRGTIDNARMDVRYSLLMNGRPLSGMNRLTQSLILYGYTLSSAIPALRCLDDEERNFTCGPLGESFL